jgi:hypothetical protein
MKFRTTAILLAVFVAILAYFFLVEEKKRSVSEKERTESRRILPYEPGDVERFIFINQGGERVEIERSGSTWNVVSPVVTLADAPAIGSFLGQTVPGRKGNEIAGVASLAEYGLAPPFASLMIYHRGAAEPDTLYVGDQTPTSSGCYVRLGSSNTILIATNLTHGVMNKSLLHFRDKNFLAFESGAIDGLAIRSGSKELRLAREGSGWYVADRRVRADRRKIEAYLTELTRAVIRQFVREDLEALEQYGLKAPVKELLVTHGGETTRIAFGAKAEDEVYAVRTGLDKVIRLESKLLEPFEWNAAALRAMNLAFFQSDSVAFFTYETPDTTVVFKKTGGTWSASGADSASVQSNEVRALLWKLGSATFDEIVKEPLPGGASLASPAIRVTLTNATGATLDQITLAEPVRGTETGASISANAIGALRQGTFDDIRTIFKRIGSKR